MTNDEHIQDLLKELWDGKQCLVSDDEYYILKPNLAETCENYLHSRKLYKFDKRAGRYKTVKGSMKDFFAKVTEFGNYSLKPLK